MEDLVRSNRLGVASRWTIALILRGMLLKGSLVSGWSPQLLLFVQWVQGAKAAG